VLTRCGCKLSAQLASARLPADTNVESFAAALFQWSSGLTLQGSNLPFALPQRVDRIPLGFTARMRHMRHAAPLRLVTPSTLPSADMTHHPTHLTPPTRVPQLSLLERDASGQSLVAVASITAEVEDVSGTSILVVTGKPSAKLEALVDIPLIMSAMPPAIRRAVITSRPPAAQ
jgi:hypothetical protein